MGGRRSGHCLQTSQGALLTGWPSLCSSCVLRAQGPGSSLMGLLPLPPQPQKPGPEGEELLADSVRTISVRTLYLVSTTVDRMSEVSVPALLRSHPADDAVWSGAVPPGGSSSEACSPAAAFLRQTALPPGPLAAPAPVPHACALHRGADPLVQEPRALGPEEAGGGAQRPPHTVRLPRCAEPTGQSWTQTPPPAPSPAPPSPGPASYSFSQSRPDPAPLLPVPPPDPAPSPWSLAEPVLSFAVTLPSPYAIATRLLVSDAARPSAFTFRDRRRPPMATTRGVGSPLRPPALAHSRPRRGHCLALGAHQALLLGFWGAACTHGRRRGPGRTVSSLLRLRLRRLCLPAPTWGTAAGPPR